VRLATRPALERGLELLALATRRGVSALILDRWSLGGRLLDPFVLAAAVADSATSPIGVGALVELGAGRAASVAMRELAALEQLAPGRSGLVLAGQGERLGEAAEVALALLEGPPATAGGKLEGIAAAPNLPPPGVGAASRIILLDRAAGEARRLDGEPLGLRQVTGLDDLGPLAVDELLLYEELAEERPGIS
jgi:alkanesulfonate monooxygenase SsuD/methylene tetrahydromethanopterin reductase-like flavin-dependent oxidoreductase (luciferase family)